MRKQIISSTQQASSPPTGSSDANEWLPLEQLAMVEISSEEADHPVESALLPDRGEGWRAGQPGKQLLRLRFDEPQALRLIRLHFTERERERTQEFVLRYSSEQGATLQEIVRKQWSFSPQGSTSQTEEYHVDLAGVTILELAITPDISGGDARASLAELRLA
jgi:hypothetical protein